MADNEEDESDNYSTDDSNLQGVTGKFEDISLPQVELVVIFARESTRSSFYQNF